MATLASSVTNNRIVHPDGLSNMLQGTIKAAIKSAEVATNCEWLLSEGYASDMAHARELVNAAIYG